MRYARGLLSALLGRFGCYRHDNLRRYHDSAFCAAHAVTKARTKHSFMGIQMSLGGPLGSASRVGIDLITG